MRHVKGDTHPQFEVEGVGLRYTSAPEKGVYVPPFCVACFLKLGMRPQML